LNLNLEEGLYKFDLIEALTALMPEVGLFSASSLLSFFSDLSLSITFNPGLALKSNVLGILTCPMAGLAMEAENEGFTERVKALVGSILAENTFFVAAS
jgi:hypothetical protein